MNEWMNQSINQWINQKSINQLFKLFQTPPLITIVGQFIVVWWLWWWPQMMGGWTSLDAEATFQTQIVGFRREVGATLEKSQPQSPKYPRKTLITSSAPLFSLQIGGILQISWLPPSLPIADPSPLFSQLQIIVNWQGKETQGSHKCLDSDTTVFWQWWSNTSPASMCSPHQEHSYQGSW